VSNHLSKLLFLGSMFGERVEEQVHIIFQLITATRSALLLAVKHKKPSDSELSALFSEPLSLERKLSEFRKKDRFSDLVEILACSAPTVACLFHSDCAAQMSASKKAIEEFLSKHKGNSHVTATFIETVSNFVVSLTVYLDDKHLTGGLAWTGSTDFDAHVKLHTSVHGHLSFLSLSCAPSKILGKILQKQETWSCHFWCAERGPVHADPKDKDCEIFGCVSSEITLKKAGHVVI